MNTPTCLSNLNTPNPTKKTTKSTQKKFPKNPQKNTKKKTKTNAKTKAKTKARNKKPPNQYLKDFQDAFKKRLKEPKDWLTQGANLLKVRERLRKKYAYAIPNQKAIDALVKLSPLTEIGAGNGYWAHLIEKHGGTINAYDRHIKNNPYKLENFHFPVQQGSERILLRSPKNHTLLLCWPPYQTAMASNALKYFQGNKIAYIGEPEGGCTGDDAFHKELTTNWTLSKKISIPQWPNLHDALFIYTKKQS